MINLRIKKINIATFVFLCSLLFLPTASLAVEPSYSTDDYPFDENGNYTGPENPVPQREYPELDGSGVENNVAESFFDCSVTSILANAISTAVKNAISQAVGQISGQEVPTIESPQRFKDAGYYLFDFIPIVPSWDSFAYCLVNKTIAYISDATILWIRSGFEGNPAFVNNPERFFRQIADLEYENFLEGVAAEMACNPFRVEVINTVAGSYNRRFEDYGRCSLYDGGGNVDGFLNGAFDYDIWNRYTQNPANNPIGSAHLLRAELNNRISQKQNTISLELDWGNGFLPWKDMEGNTVSPGNVIEAQLEERLGIDSNRLAFADEFDEVINELVNYLVKLALDETLGVLGESSI